MITRHRERDITQWGPAQEFSSLADFDVGFDAVSQVFSIDLDGLPFDGMYRRGEGDTLFVFFSPALAHKPGRKLPIFSWVAHSRKCTGSSLILADPAILLSEQLTLGWYLGTRATPLQPVLERVIAKVVQATGAARVAFVGTSGGGFPALWLAGRFAGSAALVNAPTTTLTGHQDPSAVQRFEKIAADGMPVAKGAWTHCLPDTSTEFGSSKIIITQNRADRYFIDHHVRPFMDALGVGWTGADIVTDSLLLRMGNPAVWGAGHVMPPPKVTRRILDALDFTEGAGFTGLDLAALHQQI